MHHAGLSNPLVRCGGARAENAHWEASFPQPGAQTPDPEGPCATFTSGSQGFAHICSNIGEPLADPQKNTTDCNITHLSHL